MQCNHAHAFATIIRSAASCVASLPAPAPAKMGHPHGSPSSYGGCCLEYLRHPDPQPVFSQLSFQYMWYLMLRQSHQPSHSRTRVHASSQSSTPYHSYPPGGEGWARGIGGLGGRCHVQCGRGEASMPISSHGACWWRHASHQCHARIRRQQRHAAALAPTFPPHGGIEGGHIYHDGRARYAAAVALQTHS